MKRFTVAVGLLMLMALGVGPATAQTGHDLFQQALLKERAEGELGEAIQLYERIVREFAADRTLAARALMQMGQCWEMLGSAEAEEAYQRVVRDFADQPDLVSQAEARLAALMAMQRAALAAEVERQPTFRRIEIASKPQNGVLSPDGTKLAFVADSSVWMVPLHGRVDPDIAGEPVRLTEGIGAWDDGNLLSWSADGEWIAVNAVVQAGWVGPQWNGIALVNVGARSARVFPVPTARWGGISGLRVSLSPDGSTLAYSGIDPDLPEPESQPAGVHSRYIFTVPASGGTPQKLTRHWSRQPAYSPDGRHLAYVGPLVNGLPLDDVSAEAAGITRNDIQVWGLWMVAAGGGEPVLLASGDGIGWPAWSSDGAFLAGLRRTEGESQIWVYRVGQDGAGVGEPVKIDLPRQVWHALAGWTPEGDLGVLIPTEEWAAVYTVPASGGKAVQVSPEGWPFDPDWSPDGERIYARLSDNFIGSVPADGGEWEPIPLLWDWPIATIVSGGGIHVSPDGETVVFAGFEQNERRDGVNRLWTIPVAGGQPTPLTPGGEVGGSFPCWSPDGSLIAFIEDVEGSDGHGYRAVHLIPAEGGEARIITGETDGVSDASIAFAPDGGRIAFFSEKAIKTASLSGGEPRTLIRIEGSDDDSELAWSPSGEAIAFSQGGRIWVASLAGGEPQEVITGLSGNMRLKHVSWSPDGEKIAFMGVTGGDVELWMISDFLR